MSDSERAFRCEGDITLQKELSEDRTVREVQKKLDEDSSGSVRRRLLATSLRLTKSMSPALHTMMHDCSETLELDIPTEVYVYNSPTFNAACVKPEDGRLFLMFSSAILEKFDRDELRFVMGHEFGHHLFSHHDIPIGPLVSGDNPVGARLALKLFSWSRYAEISADRAGAMCTADADASARALFKLASGVTSDLIQIHIDEFAAQADEMKSESEADLTDSNEEDWFLTHPFTPLRVRALQAIYESSFRTEGGFGKEQLEARIHDLMDLMAPTYLKEDSRQAELMRRVLFAAGCVLMRVSGGINDREIEAFNSLFGEGTFSESLNIDLLAERLDGRIEEANESVPIARRTQILRDLCLIAIADGRVTRKERELIHDVGEKLQLSSTVVDHCFERRAELD